MKYGLLNYNVGVSVIRNTKRSTTIKEYSICIFRFAHFESENRFARTQLESE